MSASKFEALEDVYPQVIEQMKNEFDSHDFILNLAHRYQKLYVQALIEYADKNQPFQSVHKEIAKRLKKFPQLVSNTGQKRNSENIFRVNSRAEIWRKVKA